MVEERSEKKEVGSDHRRSSVFDCSDKFWASRGIPRTSDGLEMDLGEH